MREKQGTQICNHVSFSSSRFALKPSSGNMGVGKINDDGQIRNSKLFKACRMAQVDLKIDVSIGYVGLKIGDIAGRKRNFVHSVGAHIIVCWSCDTLSRRWRYNLSGRCMIWGLRRRPLRGWEI